MKEILQKVNKLSSIKNSISPSSGKSVTEILNDYGSSQETYNTFIAVIKRGVWVDLIDKSKIEKYMTSKLKRTFEDYVNKQSNIEISEANINKFIDFVMLNKGTILENGVEELFDDLTKYDNENRFYPQ